MWIYKECCKSALETERKARRELSFSISLILFVSAEDILLLSVSPSQSRPLQRLISLSLTPFFVKTFVFFPRWFCMHFCCVRRDIVWKGEGTLVNSLVHLSRIQSGPSPSSPFLPCLFLSLPFPSSSSFPIPPSKMSHHIYVYNTISALFSPICAKSCVSLAEWMEHLPFNRPLPLVSGPFSGVFQGHLSRLGHHGRGAGDIQEEEEGGQSQRMKGGREGGWGGEGSDLTGSDDGDACVQSLFLIFSLSIFPLILLSSVSHTHSYVSKLNWILLPPSSHRNESWTLSRVERRRHLHTSPSPSFPSPFSLSLLIQFSIICPPLVVSSWEKVSPSPLSIPWDLQFHPHFVIYDPSLSSIWSLISVSVQSSVHYVWIRGCLGCLLSSSGGRSLGMGEGGRREGVGWRGVIAMRE